MNKLTNKIVFITGASAGFGKAIAELFAEHKANLILAARRIDRLRILSAELSKKYKIKVKIIKLDVRNNDEVIKVISKLGKDWQNIDILINNAGLARGFNKIYEGSEEDWNEMIDTNIKGLLYVTRQILPLMVERKSGHIINIGSTAGHEVYPYGNVYAATKFAVKSLTQSIRLDVLDKDIKVSSVDPGMAETEFSLVRFSGDKKRASNIYKGLKPLQADDVAEAVLFCVTRPEHVNINEIILTPLAQASSNHIIRKKE
ncbi:MAG TPA: SDR family NAD(P)-dependent oxidoreductase [Ignavibacteriaceae bacterium]|nr:SDR family NAD(P)-dependent oxidoreductase [Ignavibacteriaceae bacterium]